MKNALLFLISKPFLKNLGLALGLVILLVTITLGGLRLYTNHGEMIEVPNCVGLTQAQFEKLIVNADLRFEVIDSVHVNNVTPGAVVEQSPKHGSKVKSNRNIFLTINAFTAEKILVPYLTDYSLRNAQVILEGAGLKTGRLIYKSSEYKNLVLGIEYKGNKIEPGTPLERGTAVDLLIGMGLSDVKTNLPNIVGYTVSKAQNSLQQLSLNIGTIAYDTTIVTPVDSAQAIIYRQDPNATDGGRLYLGSSVDIWVTSLNSYQRLDSLRMIQNTDKAINANESETFE